MIYYKVLRRNEDRLFSAIVGRLNGTVQFCLEYIPDEWISPSLGKIFVFSSLDNAIDFVNERYTCSFEIWECEVENPNRSVYSIPYADPHAIIKFWKNEDGLSLKPAPEGTVFCDRVKIIKKVLSNYE